MGLQHAGRTGMAWGVPFWKLELMSHSNMRQMRMQPQELPTRQSAGCEMTASYKSSWRLMYLDDEAGALVLVLCKQQQRACAQHGNDAAHVDAVPASGAVMREPSLLFYEFVICPVGKTPSRALYLCA